MGTDFQVSAGGVIFREEGGVIEIALITPKGKNQGKVWCLPKGLIVKGESVEHAAIREVEEETGLRGKVIDRIERIQYWYTIRDEEGNAIKRLKTVYFFLIRCTGGDIGDHDDEVAEVRWFPVDDAIDRASYKSEKYVVSRGKMMIVDYLQSIKG